MHRLLGQNQRIAQISFVPSFSLIGPVEYEKRCEKMDGQDLNYCERQFL